MLHPTLNIVQPPAVTQQKPPTGENANKGADGLTPAQIEVLLKAVPVFSLTDAGGQPIVSKVPDATKGVTAIFMSPGTASAALAQIKLKMPSSRRSSKSTLCLSGTFTSLQPVRHHRF